MVKKLIILLLFYLDIGPNYSRCDCRITVVGRENASGRFTGNYALAPIKVLSFLQNRLTTIYSN